MTDFERALEFTRWWERGYVNDPDDPGGRTDDGVSEAAHPDVWKDGVVTEDEKRAVYATYWKAVEGDTVPWPVNAALFDFAVNSGGWREVVTYAPLATGTALGDALEVCARRAAYLMGLSRRKPKYKKGWLNRVDSLQRFCRGEKWR